MLSNGCSLSNQHSKPMFDSADSFTSFTRHTYSWFLKTPLDRVNSLEIMIVIRNIMCDLSYKIVSLSFDSLPSSISISMRRGDEFNEDEYTDDEFFNIITDGNINSYESRNIAYKKQDIDHTSMEIEDQGFCHVPIKRRYGAYTLINDNNLEYVRDFWMCDSAKDIVPKPQMIHVKKGELSTYEMLS